MTIASDPSSESIDLGHDARYSLITDPDGDVIGMLFDHPAGGRRCHGAVYFDTPAACRIVLEKHRWHLVHLQPLSLTPALTCGRCGARGWIRAGRWAPATSTT